MAAPQETEKAPDRKAPGLPPDADLIRDLTSEERWLLEQWALPCDRPITDHDLKKCRLVRDAGHRKRQEARGLALGHWHLHRRFYYPIEIAAFLLTLQREPPPSIRHPWKEDDSRRTGPRRVGRRPKVVDTEAASVPPADDVSDAKPRRRHAKPAKPTELSDSA
jgi:hypothetical protein